MFTNNTNACTTTSGPIDIESMRNTMRTAMQEMDEINARFEYDCAVLREQGFAVWPWGRALVFTKASLERFKAEIPPADPLSGPISPLMATPLWTLESAICAGFTPNTDTPEETFCRLAKELIGGVRREFADILSIDSHKPASDQ